MPATWRRIQFLGSDLGQNGSTWNFGASLACACSSGAAATTTAATTNEKILIMLTTSSHVSGFVTRLDGSFNHLVCTDIVYRAAVKVDGSPGCRWVLAVQPTGVPLSPYGTSATSSAAPLKAAYGC